MIKIATSPSNLKVGERADHEHVADIGRQLFGDQCGAIE